MFEDVATVRPQGRTLAQALREALGIEELPSFTASLAYEEVGQDEVA